MAQQQRPRGVAVRFRSVRRVRNGGHHVGIQRLSHTAVHRHRLQPSTGLRRSRAGCVSWSQTDAPPPGVACDMGAAGNAKLTWAASKSSSALSAACAGDSADDLAVEVEAGVVGRWNDDAVTSLPQHIEPVE